jgi:hypothetical protein
MVTAKDLVKKWQEVGSVDKFKETAIYKEAVADETKADKRKSNSSGSKQVIQSIEQPKQITTTKTTTKAEVRNSNRIEKSGAFDNSFFSVAGQKERLTNVANWVKYSFTGSPRTDYKLNPDYQPNIVEQIASHPYLTAGVGATAWSVGTALAGYGSTTAAVGSSTTATAIGTATATKSTSIGIGKSLSLAAAGFFGGSLLTGKSGLTAAPQDQNLSQQPSVINDSRQENIQTTTQNTYYNIINSPNANLQGSPVQTPNFTPVQYIPTYQETGMTATQGQESSGTNWGMIAAIGLGAAFLMR